MARRRPLEKRDPEAPMRVVLYARVSTPGQAQADLSIPDQVAQMRHWAAEKDAIVFAEFVDAGYTATDTNRPGFQEMIDGVMNGEMHIDAIVVHSLSRIFRDSIAQGSHRRMLAKRGCTIISITQEFGHDNEGEFFAQIIASYDEYSSKETAKHVTRTMKVNAKEGYSNGGVPPFGYRRFAVGQKGDRIKSKYEVDPVEAEIVRTIFDLAVEGDGRSGPLGVKRIADTLNKTGVRTRKGNLFTTGGIHEILTREAYAGTRRWNVRSNKTGEFKCDTEVIAYEVPVIVEREVFDRVQQLLADRDPQKSPPRYTASPTLLGGIAVCEACGAAMTARTGTSRRGTVYQYYACSAAGRKGATACKGQWVSAPKLDAAVIEGLAERVLQPAHVMSLLDEAMKARAADKEAVHSRIAMMTKEVKEAGDKLDRLYGAIETGIVSISDPTLKKRVDDAVADRDRARAALDRILASETSVRTIDPMKVQMFSSAMATTLRTGDVGVRKAWVNALVDRIVVGKTGIRVIGKKDLLARAVDAGGDLTRTARPVRSSVSEWCPGRQHILCLSYCNIAYIHEWWTTGTPKNTPSSSNNASRPSPIIAKSQSAPRPSQSVEFSDRISITERIS